jgi:hypothetical protein
MEALKPLCPIRPMRGLATVCRETEKGNKWGHPMFHLQRVRRSSSSVFHHDIFSPFFFSLRSLDFLTFFFLHHPPQILSVKHSLNVGAFSASAMDVNGIFFLFFLGLLAQW